MMSGVREDEYGKTYAPRSGRLECRLDSRFPGIVSRGEAFVELKLRLSKSLRKHRTRQNLSQTALAKKLKSSQSRVAKMEAADPTVSIDLLIRALLAIGATHNDLAKAVARFGK